MNRDLLVGIGFFALMGIGGALLVWLNWRKIGAEEQRQAQKNRVQQVVQHLAVARTKRELAELSSDESRRQALAREAAEAYGRVLEAEPGEAAYWAERAAARLLLGDKEAARRDLDQAKRLDPQGDWAELERRCAP